MAQEYEFTINGQLFYVNLYDGGWAWWSAYNEMDGYADTPLEALQNAIDYVQKQIDENKPTGWEDFKQLPESMNPDRWKENG